jgi:hypothetical protein
MKARFSSPNMVSSRKAVSGLVGVDHPEGSDFTTVAAAVSLDEDNFAFDGRHWDEATQSFVAFTTAPEEPCKRGRR